MSVGKLSLLGVAAIALLAVALWYSASRRPSQDTASQAPLLAGLTERLNALERVRITGAGAQTLATLERSDDGWRLAERGGYPVDSGKLRTLLLGLAEARRLEAKTSNPELHDRLGVEDVSAADAGGVLLELEGGGSPLRLVIGNNVTRGSGAYVRDADQPQSWQVDRNLAVEKQPANWLQRELTDIDTARIAEVEVRPVGGAAVKIERSHDSAGDFTLAALPRGREPASEFVADSTAGLLSGLRLDDVIAVDGVQPDPASLRETRFLAREGLRVQLTSWQADGKTYARFAASLDAQRADAWIDQQQAEALTGWEEQQRKLDADADKASSASDASDDVVDPDADVVDAADADNSDKASDASEANDTELAPAAPLAVSDPNADRAQRLQTLQDEVAALDARFDGWVFVLPSFKAANLNRDLEAYLKPKD